MTAVVYSTAAVVLLLALASVIGLVLYVVWHVVNRWANNRVERDVNRAMGESIWRDVERGHGRDWR